MPTFQKLIDWIREQGGRNLGPFCWSFVLALAFAVGHTFLLGTDRSVELTVALADAEGSKKATLLILCFMAIAMILALISAKTDTLVRWTLEPLRGFCFALGLASGAGFGVCLATFALGTTQDPMLIPAWRMCAIAAIVALLYLIVIDVLFLSLPRLHHRGR